MWSKHDGILKSYFVLLYFDIVSLCCGSRSEVNLNEDFHSVTNQPSVDTGTMFPLSPTSTIVTALDLSAVDQPS